MTQSLNSTFAVPDLGRKLLPRIKDSQTHDLMPYNVFKKALKDYDL